MVSGSEERCQLTRRSPPSNAGQMHQRAVTALQTVFTLPGANIAPTRLHFLICDSCSNTFSTCEPTFQAERDVCTLLRVPAYSTAACRLEGPACAQH